MHFKLTLQGAFPLLYLSKGAIYHIKYRDKGVNVTQRIPPECVTTLLVKHWGPFKGITGDLGRRCFPFSQKVPKFRLRVKWNSNFRKIRSEIVDYLKRSLFPFGTERRKFPYHLLTFLVFSLSFPSFGKTLTIIQRPSQPVYSVKW